MNPKIRPLALTRQVGELARCENPGSLVCSQRQQVPVSCHNHVRAARYGCGQDLIVVRISGHPRQIARLYQVRQRLDLGAREPRDGSAKPELADKNILQLVEQCRTRHKRDVTAYSGAQENTRQASEQQRRDQHIGVKQNSHLPSPVTVLLDSLKHIIFGHPQSLGDPLPVREQALPTVTAIEVLAQRNTRQLTTGQALRVGFPINLSSKVGRQRDRDRACRPHAHPSCERPSYSKDATRVRRARPRSVWPRMRWR